MHCLVEHHRVGNREAAQDLQDASAAAAIRATARDRSGLLPRKYAVHRSQSAGEASRRLEIETIQARSSGANGFSNAARSQARK